MTRGIQNCNLGLPVTPAGRDGPACRQGTEATKRNSTLSDKCQAQTFIMLLLITKKKKKIRACDRMYNGPQAGPSSNP